MKKANPLPGIIRKGFGNKTASILMALYESKVPSAFGILCAVLIKEELKGATQIIRELEHILVSCLL